MKTRKQKRAEYRIAIAKERKDSNFQAFLRRLAKRRLPPEDCDYVRTGFHCLPGTLGMTVEEFLSKGTPLVRGQAVLFKRNELRDLIPNWRCDSRLYPHIILVSYIKYYYNDDGSQRSRHNRDPAFYSGTSGAFYSGTSGSSSSW